MSLMSSKNSYYFVYILWEIFLHRQPCEPNISNGISQIKCVNKQLVMFQLPMTARMKGLGHVLISKFTSKLMDIDLCI